MPLWCAMVTRTVSLKSEEGQEPGAKEAVAKEVASHAERGTWDLSRVRELSEWMRDEAYFEVLVGRVFATLGVKFAEMAKSERKFRVRAVYQGNNIWSRSATSNPSCRGATSTPRPWYLRSSALSGFSSGCRDPATTAAVDDLTVLRRGRSGKFVEISLPFWAA